MKGLNQNDNNSNDIEIHNLINNIDSKKFQNTQKIEEIKFFLREYQSFDGTECEYYYLVPFKWIKRWDDYITDKE
jgi:hypothetical protein